MDITQAFESKYVKATDLDDRQHRLVIKSVSLEEMKNRSGDTEKRPVVYFEGKKKGWVLNKTNAKVLTASYGKHTEHWTGKEIVIFPMMVDSFGEMTEGIRCKIPQPVAAPPQHQAELNRAAQEVRQAHSEINPPDAGGGGFGGTFDEDIPFN